VACGFVFPAGITEAHDEFDRFAHLNYLKTPIMKNPPCNLTVHGGLFGIQLTSWRLLRVSQQRLQELLRL
jgi:hypothetical protein